MTGSASLWILLAQRAWQGGAGLISAAIIATFISPEGQGWYYSFMSVAAVAALFDFGLSIVLSQTAARNSIIATGLSANAQLLRRYAVYYAVAASIYVVTSLLLGEIFFGSRAGAAEKGWLAPWLALVCAIAANMLMAPFFAIQEGAGSQGGVYLVRLCGGVVGALATWGGLLLLGPLWSCCVAPACAAVISAAWIWNERNSPLMSAVRAETSADRPLGLWSLQVRVTVSWISGYLLIQLAPPILFRVHTAEDAGRMGLSLALANMVGILAQSPIVNGAPSMTRSVQERRWTELDRRFRNAFLTSLGIFGGLALPLGALRLLADGSHYAARLIDPQSFILLLLAVLSNHICGALASQLRSFQREPLVWLVLSGALLSLVLTIAIAPEGGAQGVTKSYFFIQMALLLSALVTWSRQNRILRQ